MPLSNPARRRPLCHHREAGTDVSGYRVTVGIRGVDGSGQWDVGGRCPAVGRRGCEQSDLWREDVAAEDGSTLPTSRSGCCSLEPDVGHDDRR
ncbi:hypothetical protein E2562_027541 [Oryza meyeriana var. granulata]|uniref:Uncharacterized protein n=1 Tax=Oryza meyeriana var. granulata TaxID=110450 RepID=A0A6G1CKL9_9ORYZ|nr:hypothetical protein E2562_027541 [Oryza meyeriana var. granulata]KAF0900173.1 hypothetical protein E2562_027541 [Oryza meyeriana var. granulata]KAF0900174.1 hypothetical protein E2562_027541 [Oryza meyeriana var. granulata]KAF0900175.1 hypothetical protein E2562_027541 [Oryza meyeriana var. granulata]KAF0900176.1 hypothetical protein E2562_027541 [Oryza meyeriana var. granulata]